MSAAADLAPRVYDDFPAAPILDSTLPADLPAQFGASSNADGGGAGPCMSEPSMGALIPRNFTPLYFAWRAASDENVFELRLHVDNQRNDLVVYTTATTYALPATMWAAFTASSADHDIEVSIRGARLASGALVGAPKTGTTGSVRVAPVDARGDIVYWTTSNGSALKGYKIGASGVTTVVTPALMNDGTSCVGCHTSTPDGKYAFLSRAAGTSTGSFSVDARAVDGTAAPAPSTAISANARANLARPNQTLPVLSPAHYAASDAVVLTTLTNAATAQRAELVWTDLHATSGGTGVLARVGDPGEATTPAWSHDGTRIAYASAAGSADGRPTSALTDLYLVPYNAGAGGTAQPIPGAANPTVHEYYPAFSPDDALVIYNESPGSADTYDEPTAELRLIPTSGGTPHRLAANDPPACTGKASPGITNSWPRWSPEIGTAAGKRYFWIVFSSRRSLLTSNPQLYIAAVTVDAAGSISSYPAVWVSAQPSTEANHTPAWDVFQTPVL